MRSAKPRWVPHSVHRIVALGDDLEVSRRLAQLGLLPGAEIAIVRTVPLGGPVEIATGVGQNLALRAEEMGALVCEAVAFPLASGSVDALSVYRVRALLGKPGFTRKMEQRGIAVGSRFRVLWRRPFVLDLIPAQRRITLGLGEAAKLLVEPEREGSQVG
jgi:Fe2+ transport system protein FeoA